MHYNYDKCVRYEGIQAPHISLTLRRQAAHVARPASPCAAHAHAVTENPPARICRTWILIGECLPSIYMVADAVASRAIDMHALTAAIRQFRLRQMSNVAAKHRRVSCAIVRLIRLPRLAVNGPFFFVSVPKRSHCVFHCHSSSRSTCGVYSESCS